jgi:hypothetical protein
VKRDRQNETNGKTVGEYCNFGIAQLIDLPKKWIIQRRGICGKPVLTPRPGRYVVYCAAPRVVTNGECRDNSGQCSFCGKDRCRSLVSEAAFRIDRIKTARILAGLRNGKTPRQPQSGSKPIAQLTRNMDAKRFR